MTSVPNSRLVSLDACDAAKDQVSQLLLAIPGNAGHADDLARMDHQVDLLQAEPLRPSPRELPG